MDIKVFMQCAASLYRNVCPSVSQSDVRIRKKSTQPHLVPGSCTCVCIAFYCIVVILSEHRACTDLWHCRGAATIDGAIYILSFLLVTFLTEGNGPRAWNIFLQISHFSLLVQDLVITLFLKMKSLTVDKFNFINAESGIGLRLEILPSYIQTHPVLRGHIIHILQIPQWQALGKYM